MLTDDNGSGAVAWHARAESQGGNWALCYNSSTDCTACPSATYNQYGYSCSCPSGSTSFHGGCDAHSQTVVIGHNSLGFTFGGFAQATWAGNSDDAAEAAGDFLFRLGPGATPVAYRPTGKDTYYQYRPSLGPRSLQYSNGDQCREKDSGGFANMAKKRN